jgi:hypothetical protein
MRYEFLALMKFAVSTSVGHPCSKKVHLNALFHSAHRRVDMKFKNSNELKTLNKIKS